MTKGKVWQVCTLILAFCVAVAANIGLLKGVVSEAGIALVLFATTVISSALPNVLKRWDSDSVKRDGSVLIVCSVFGVFGCAELQQAKEPAQELWYAAELVCRMDLQSIPAVQAIGGAADLIDDVCRDVEVARPYVEVLLREQRERGIDPLFRARQNALLKLRAKVALRGRK